jgi:hypothetical protein
MDTERAQKLMICAVIASIVLAAVAMKAPPPPVATKFRYDLPAQIADLGGFSTTPRGNLTRDPMIAGMIEKMNETNMYSTVDVLQRIPTREYGTTGNVEAADFLYRKLSGIPGLEVKYGDGSFKNIIAILPGTDNSSDGIVMVGAHYDSTSSDPARAPGATDNACGDAIVLELARIMSQYQFNHTIAFALWNSEEHSPTGSTAYAESAANSGLMIPLYFNYDSPCYDPLGHLILDIMYNAQSSWAAEMMTQDNTLYGINVTLTYNVHITHGSDHWSFWLHGYPAVMTHSETHGPQHTPNDTIDQVSFKYALKNGQLGLAVLAQVAEVRGLAHNTWRTQAVDSTGIVSEFISLQLTPTGWPTISYYDTKNGDLKYTYMSAS